MAPIWVLEQSQSHVSGWLRCLSAPTSLTSVPMGMRSRREAWAQENDLVGILAHHLLAVHLGQFPLPEPQFSHLFNGSDGQSFLVGLS